MITGATVIYNDVYIEELTRHLEAAKKKYEMEDMPDAKELALKQYKSLEEKLNWVMSFQDTVEQVFNVEVPSIMVIKTMTGFELPAKVVQVI